MLKTRTWILLLSAAAVLLAVLSFFLLRRPAGSRVAEVVQDGRVIETVDLDRVAQEYTFTVVWPEGGSNTVLVRPGRIRVTEADCPDQICVQQGWLTEQAAPVVCLPHRLVIRLQGEGGTDATAR